MLRVNLGIGDMDSYSMLFYGNYHRYNERAANSCLPADAPVGAAAVLKKVHIIKYTKSVGWNDVIDIRSLLAAEDTLLHEWLVDGKVVHTCLAQYDLRGGAVLSGAQKPDGKPDERRIFANQRAAADLFTPPAACYRRDRIMVTPDMIGPGGGVFLGSVMDFYERQRTELIGGQAELERLTSEDGVQIVVYSISQLELHGTPVQPRELVEVSSGFLLQNDMYYCVHQSVTHVPSGAKIADGYCKLVFAKPGAGVVKAPAATAARLEAATAAAMAASVS